MIEEPADFEEFWLAAKQEADAVKLDYWREPKEFSGLTSHNISILRFRSVHNAVLEGWVASPKGTRKAPGFLWINPYGRESLLPNEYGTRPGYLSFCFNFFGLPAFHQEKYVPERGYFSEGLADPNTFVFKTLIQHCLVALRVLQAQLDVDEDRIGVMGLSQGGGFALASAAWSEIPKAVCADLPFFGLITETISQNFFRYPLKEILDFAENHQFGKELVHYTLSYYDTVFQAKRIKQPTHVTLGLKDPSCRPPQVRAIFEALVCEKSLTELDWGHDWHPSMIETNLLWLNQHLMG